MSEMIQYHNDLNTLQMSGFTEKEIDIFYAICYRLKNQGTNEINVNYKEIRELTHFKHRSIEKLHDSIDSTFRKLLGLSIRLDNERYITRFVLFTEYKIDKEKRIVSIQVHDKFKYLLNDFMSNYTKFELTEMVSLKSTYSKTLYRTLKQFRATGWYEVLLSQFRYLLDVPEGYDTNNFNKRVLAPILDELPRYFKNLKIEKIRKGRKIDKLKFTWDVKEIEIIKKSEEVDEKIPSEKIALKASIPVLNDKDIEVLLKSADISKILEKYYTLAVGKEIENLTGFLLSAIKNDWKTVTQAEKEFKKETGEMDELEAKIQKRLYLKLAEKEKNKDS